MFSLYTVIFSEAWIQSKSEEPNVWPPKQQSIKN